MSDLINRYTYQKRIIDAFKTKHADIYEMIEKELLRASADLETSFTIHFTLPLSLSVKRAMTMMLESEGYSVLICDYSVDIFL